MASLVEQIAELARTVAQDQIAQDIETNSKLADKADASELEELAARVAALESRLSGTPVIVESLDEVEAAENDGYYWVNGLYDEEET